MIFDRFDLPHPRRPIGAVFWVVMVLFAYEAGSGLWWVYMDLSIRYVPGAAYDFPADVVDFVQKVPAWQEALFFGGVATLWISVILLFLRNPWVLLSYSLTILLSKSDWIISALNGFEFLSAAGYLSLIREMIAMAGLLLYQQMGGFRRQA